MSSTPNPLFHHNYLLLTPCLLSKWNEFLSICRMFMTLADFRQSYCKTATCLGWSMFLDSIRWHSFHWHGWSNPTFESLINKQAYEICKIDEFIWHFYSLHHTKQCSYHHTDGNCNSILALNKWTAHCSTKIAFIEGAHKHKKGNGHYAE